MTMACLFPVETGTAAKGECVLVRVNYTDLCRCFGVRNVLVCVLLRVNYTDLCRYFGVQEGRAKELCVPLLSERKL
jgi:hypothetical protein